MTVKKILIFGNPLVTKDSLPLKLIDDLRNEFPHVEFKEFDSIEEIQNEGEPLYILDSVEKIKKVMIISDLDQLATNKIYSVHDFDLATILKILKKLNMIQKIIIIGVPIKIPINQALQQIREKIISISIEEND